jgi:type IV pilus assembly protein PilV
MEILVTLLVMTTGLFGLAGLQAKNLSQLHASQLHSRATMVMTDLLERLQANRSGAVDNGYILDTRRDQLVDLDCRSRPCTPAQIAQSDLYQWRTLVKKHLPASVATITGRPNGYLITVTWNQGSPRPLEPLCTQAASQDCLTVEFQL